VKRRRRATRGPTLCTLIVLLVVRIKRGEIGVHEAVDARRYVTVKYR
jgi:hypothetical protein